MGGHTDSPSEKQLQHVPKSSDLLSENPELHVQLHLLHKTVDKPLLDVYKTALLLKRYGECEVRASGER